MSNLSKSNSVGNITNVFSWVLENLKFLMIRIKGLNNLESSMDAVLAEIDEYASRYYELTGLKFEDANILELGYGARPNRLIAMQSMGYSAKGIDLDQPLLSFSISELINIYKKNGIKRALKSFVRSVLFDNKERRALAAALNKRGFELKYDKDKFLVGDASTFQFEASSIDFIYSEDVFEHIPKKLIHTVCKNLSYAISANGIALISPAVFSGIAGGHLVEWYPHTLGEPVKRDAEPWEHLRKKRVVADCYLNQLRVDDYKNIFSNYFNIEKIINCNAGLGRDYLTEEIKRELFDFSEDELLSNKWTFVLKKLN